MKCYFFKSIFEDDLHENLKKWVEERKRNQQY